jgi:hypothetical protein
VFERLEVRGGRLSRQEYRPPFDDIFGVSEFEYRTRLVVPREANHAQRSLDGASTWGTQASSSHLPR